MLDRSTRLLIAASTSLVLLGSGPGPVPGDLAPGSGPVDAPAGPIRDAVERYSTDRRALERSIPAPWSEARRARLESFGRDWLAGLDRVDFDRLDRDDRIDYLLLRNDLDHGLRQLDLRAKRAAEVADLVPYGGVIVELEEARRRMEPVDAPKAAARLADLAKRVDRAREEAEATLKPRKPDGEGHDDPKPTRISRPLALRAADTVQELKASLGRWSEFSLGYDPSFTWWAAEPYKRVDDALKKHVATLREKVAGIKDDPESKEGREVVGDPVGREALLAELAHEMIPYTPEELIAAARRELAWCEAEMLKASRDMGCGDDWRKALEQVKDQYVEPGKQPGLIRDLAAEAVAFLEDRDLVTIPPLAKETWRMEMMSPKRQLVNPFFTGGEVISVSFPTDGMTHEQKLMSLRGNNAHFSRATVHHELIPGHHLQGFMAARHRAYRREFSTPFSVEGWALYWELRLWDLGFPKSPEDRVGMLFWRSHRCARIVFSLGFHLGTMTPDECVALLVDRIGHEKANAVGEVRRSFEGDYPPLYQAAYLLGGLQLRALHGELVASGKMTEKAFHDAVLKENQIPAAMIRASLSGIELDRSGSAASWKFLGPDPLKP